MTILTESYLQYLYQARQYYRISFNEVMLSETDRVHIGSNDCLCGVSDFRILAQLMAT